VTDEDVLQLRRLFEVMEQLRAPGGCPWDRSQTPQSLVPYLLEETYEAIQAIESESQQEIAEELGDLLVEVAMQIAVSAEAGEFDVGTVARGATEKMIGRHPHVFGDLQVEGVGQVLKNWEELKRREKPKRESALDGIPPALPALALAAAIQRRQGEVESGSAAATEATGALQRLIAGAPAQEADQQLVGELLYLVVALARERNVDAEGALRRHAAERRQTLRTAQVARGLEGTPAAPTPGTEALN
jgi:XTP/dITP diphosphohydrolase